MVLTSAIRASFLSTLVLIRLINYQVQLSFFCVYKCYEGQIRRVCTAGYLGSCFTRRQNRYFLGRWKKSRKKRLLPAGYHFKNYKRRTIRKVMGGGGGGGKFSSRRNFFFVIKFLVSIFLGYSINIFLGLIGGHDTGKLKRKEKLYSLWFTHTPVLPWIKKSCHHWATVVL